MRLSQFFLPLIKENPSEAAIASHRLMLRAGMIRQLTSGIYNWLPFGLLTLRKIETVIREELDAIGANEILMPSMQPVELWEESGRGGYGKETLKATDRHGREMIYGPTHEEIVTDLFRKNVKSHKQLPLTLYQIQWKFRDEIRPRFGVMRGREFLMKDAYTFATSKEEHDKLYDQMYETYFKIFRRMGLKVIPFVADTGMIGGDQSHEFQVIAETGESEIFYDQKFEELIEAKQLDIAALRSCYSAADEKHDPDNCPIPKEQLRQARGIEVGHIFYFADKYSAPMKAMIMEKGGKEVPVQMGAHGIGVSRLVGAIIESSHDEDGIIWPEAVAPFQIGIINMKPGHKECDELCDTLYHGLLRRGADVLYDDTEARAGEKFARMDLIGLPWQIIVGPKAATEGNVEMKRRSNGERNIVPAEAVMLNLGEQ